MARQVERWLPGRGAGRRRTQRRHQQKVALGRLLHQQADVLLLDEPTRGVDVASKAVRSIGSYGELAGERESNAVSSYFRSCWKLRYVAVMFRGPDSCGAAVADWSVER